MEVLTMFFICVSIAGLVLQHWKNIPPFCLLTILLALGGLVCTLDEYTKTALEEYPALILVIAMVSIMVWSSWNLVNAYLPNRKNKRV